MKKAKFLIRVNFVLLILLSNGFSQSIQFGITGGYSNIQKPGIYTKKISNDGLGLKNGFHTGAKIKIGTNKLPLKFFGIINYLKVTSSGYNEAVLPPWS